jgi:hypothetical protein
MPVCTIGASTKQRDEAGKIDERDWEIYSLVAPLGCREARTPVSGIQSDLRRRSLTRRPAHGYKVSQRVFVIKLCLDAPAGSAWIDDRLGG